MADQADRLREVVFKRAQPPVATAETACRVITVASGKGGVGKSNLVLNMALLIAQWGKRVLVLDADLGLANIDLLIGVAPRFNLSHVLAGTRELEEIIIDGPLGVKIIPGGNGLLNLAAMDQTQRGRLIDRFMRLEQEHEFMVIDTSAGISRNVLSFVVAANELVVVTTPEPTAFTDAYGLLKVAAGEGYTGRVGIVVNFARDSRQGKKVYERLQAVAQKYLLGLEIYYLGPIFFDRLVTRAVQEQIPLMLAYPASAAAKSLSRLTRRLLFREPAAEREPCWHEWTGAFMRRLLKYDLS
jgi:flagellar biosynthesis protein FlhG